MLDFVSRGDLGVRDLLASYLESGSLLAVTGKNVFDVLAEKQVVAGRLALITDGAWLWPADLSYYVRNYNILLPEDFVEYASERNWRPPELSSAELSAIEDEAFPKG